LGPKNQSFRNKSGKAQPIWAKFCERGHVYIEVTTFRELLARSAHFGQNRCMRHGTSPGARVFLCDNPEDLSATLQRPIFTRFGHETYSLVSRRGIRKDIFETFHFRDLSFFLIWGDTRSLRMPALRPAHFRNYLPPKSEIENRSNRSLTQSRLQVKGCTAEILFTPRCSPRAREFKSRLTFLSDERLRSYGASKLPNFRIFAYFPYTKPLKRIPSGDQPIQPMGLHRRMIPIFSV